VLPELRRPLLSTRGRWLAAAVAVILVAAAAFGIQQKMRIVITEESIQPEFGSPQDGAGLMVGITWKRSGFCAGQFRVKVTETATEVRVDNVISRTANQGGCADVGTVDNVAWVTVQLAAPVGSRSVVRDSDGAPLPMVLTWPTCRESIASVTQPPVDQSILFDQVALPTRSALQANRSGETDPNGRLFAKAGLYVAAGASFSLIVPDEWAGRLTIGWGNPPGRTTHLYVRACNASGSQKPWLVFAGGFWIGQPACVPLLVKTETQEQKTVQIGVGAACPGQAPPPPGN